MMIRRRMWRKLAIRRRLFSVVAVAAIACGIIAGYQAVMVLAEGNNEFSRLTSGSTWGVSNITPDPRLTWVYNGSGTADNAVDHILKFEDNSHVTRTNMRLYFDGEPDGPPPSGVTISTDVEFCNFQAQSGTLQMSIGNNVVYSQPAHREGNYMNPAETVSLWMETHKRVYRGPIGGNGPNKDYYRLTDDPTANNYAKIWEPGLPIPSRACEADPGSESYPLKYYDEGCAEENRVSDTVCKQNGSENFSVGPLISMHPTNDPPNRCTTGGSSCVFKNKTFAVDPNQIQYESSTGKWYVDVKLSLLGTDDNADKNSDGSARLQQLRYKLVASSGFWGYDLPVPDGTDPARQFGLGVERFTPADTRYGDGVKLAIPFGMRCDEAAGSRSTRIDIYDADVQSFGPTYMKVLERQPGGAVSDVATNRITNGSFGVNYETADNRLRIESGDDQTAGFNLEMERGKQYMIVVVNPDTGKLSPKQNVFSLGMTEQSVYGNGTVNCQFNLTPTISTVPTSFVYSPDISPVRGEITNEAGRSPGGDHDWQVNKIVFDRKPANMHGSQVDNFEPPCVRMASGNGGSGPRACASMNGTQVYPRVSRYDGSFTDSTTYPVGTYICFMTSVKRPAWNLDPNLWRHSNMTCSMSAKKPRVQFLGSDLRVGGSAFSSPFSVNGTSYGSWVEYGMFSFGQNSLVGSGNGLRSGGQTNPTRAWNKLTFTNTNSSRYGDYKPMPSVSSAYTYFNGLPATGNGSSLNASSPANGVYDMSGSSLGATMRLNGKGLSVILKATGNFKISRDIIVEGQNLNNVNEISQVVIVADSIDIDQDVERVDAWLVTPPTSGSINTCWRNNGGDQSLNSTICNKQLVVNGPVITNKLKLRRTAGSDTPPVENLKRAAEVFNLRPDAQLWAYNYANKADYAQTDFVLELPPRY